MAAQDAVIWKDANRFVAFRSLVNQHSHFDCCIFRESSLALPGVLSSPVISHQSRESQHRQSSNNCCDRHASWGALLKARGEPVLPLTFRKRCSLSRSHWTAHCGHPCSGSRRSRRQSSHKLRTDSACWQLPGRAVWQGVSSGNTSCYLGRSCRSAGLSERGIQRIESVGDLWCNSWTPSYG